MVVNTKYYKGDINTSAIFLDPPAELVGKINVVPEMGDVMDLAIPYIGGEPCTDDKEVLKKVRDKLVEAKPKWISLDYGTIEKFAKDDIAAASTGTARPSASGLPNPAIVYGYPKEGYPIWMDNRRRPQGRQECRERQALPELHHGS